MKVRDHSIQTHTIGQLLSLIGIDDNPKQLHVIAANYSHTGLRILYPFRSDHYAFYLVTEGELRVKLNLLEYKLPKNSVLLLTPNAVRQFIGISPDCKVASISFTGEYLSSTNIHTKNIDAFNFLSSLANPLLPLSENETHFLFSLLNIIEIKTAINDIKLAFQDEVIINTFTAFLYEIGGLYERQKESATIIGSRKEELTFRFLKILPQHYKDERSVQGYANMMNITPKYLSQAIKDVTGKTAGAFIDEMVILEAKVLLSNPALTIAQVSDHLHFSDQFFFSKFFKKQCGLSPSKYRQVS